MNKPKAKRRPRVRVLVVLNSDGCIEIYGENLSVYTAQRLHTETVGGERTADEYLELSLPKSIRELYIPRNLAACEQCRRRTVEDEAQRVTDLAIVRELREIGRDLAKPPAAIERQRRADR